MRKLRGREGLLRVIDRAESHRFQIANHIPGPGHHWRGIARGVVGRTFQHHTPLWSSKPVVDHNEVERLVVETKGRLEVRIVRRDLVSIRLQNWLLMRAV